MTSDRAALDGELQGCTQTVTILFDAKHNTDKNPALKDKIDKVIESVRLED